MAIERTAEDIARFDADMKRLAGSLAATAYRKLAIRIVDALLDTNALFPHPYDPKEKAIAVATAILKDAGISTGVVR